MKTSLLSKWMMIATVIIAALAVVASVAGLFNSSPYSLETQNWKLQAQGQDIGNLVGVVVLLVSAAYAKRGSLGGFLVWLGSLFYFVYAYIVYAVAVHFNSLFLVYVAILGLAIYALIFALAKPPKVVRVDNDGARKLAALTLMVTGALFALLWLSEIIPATITGDTPQSLQEAGLWVNPIHVIDLSVVLPGFILTGYLALNNKTWGLFYAAPWLTFSVVMGSSIVAAMILMAANGFEDTLPPMIMVSAIVLVSFVSLVTFLRKVRGRLIRYKLP